MQLSQPVGQDLVAQRRKRCTDLPERAWATHQVAKEQRRPTSGYRGESHLNRAGLLRLHGASRRIWDELGVPPVVAHRLVSVVGALFAVHMSEIATGHPNRMPLSTDPAQHPAVFASAFNSGDPSAVEQVYEAAGVLVPTPGQPVTGDDRKHANARFQNLGLPIAVEPRHVYVADDIALLIVDWKIHGTDQDGNPVHLEGTATDVARRGPDGCWRYIIDNPFGVAAAQQ